MKFMFGDDEYEIEYHDKPTRAGYRVLQAVENSNVFISEEDFDPAHLIKTLNGKPPGDFPVPIQYRAMAEAWRNITMVYYPKKKTVAWRNLTAHLENTPQLEVPDDVIEDLGWRLDLYDDWEIASRTGWTLEYIGSLSPDKYEAIQAIIRMRTKIGYDSVIRGLFT